MNRYVFRRQLHSSWLLVIVSIGVVIGVVLTKYIEQTWFSSFVWLLVACGLIGIGLWKRYIYILPLLCVGGLVFGLWRGSIEQGQLSPYVNLYGMKVSVMGNVTEDIDTSKRGEALVRLDSVSINDHPLAGKIWVTAASSADMKRGDQVTVSGRMTEGFGTFSASIYRATIDKVQRPEPGDVARHVRDWFADGVRVAIDEPQASLGIGYLVGQRRALPEDLATALQVAGLTHIVVASGYNLTILVRLTRRLFMKISKYLSALTASGMIIGFIAVTGVSPSMTRAGLIAGLSLLAWYYGRKFHPLVLLPLAAAITVLINPSYVWGDLGWQLSFAAFAGVMILAPLMQRYFFGDQKPGTVRQILGETVAAQIVTLPILVLAFSQFSNVAVIANLLILPLVPLAMLLTFIAGISGLVVPAIASILGMPAQWLLQYMTSVAHYLSSLPWAQTKLEVGGWVVGLAYVVMGGVCIYVWRRTKFNLRDSNIVE